MADAPGSTATYTLSKGTLSSGPAVIAAIGGAGHGVFNQTGGSVTVGGALAIAIASSGGGMYNLSGTGALTVNGPELVGELGTGVFNQNGGTHYVGGTLTISGGEVVSQAAYNLQNGTLTAQSVRLNAGGLFNQTGGTLNAPFIQAGGEVDGVLSNLVSFTYNGGAFNGRLVNQGAVNFGADFVAGNGMENDTSATIGPGRTVTLNGAGFNNAGSLTLAGGTLTGAGPMVNNGQISGYGTIGGSGGFINNLLMTQSGGNLTLSNTANGGVNTNNGTLNLATGYQLRFASNMVTLANAGTLNLNGGEVDGTGPLYNFIGGTITGPGTINSPFGNLAGLLLVPAGSLRASQGFGNSGVVQLTDAASDLTGAAINNTGTIQGHGHIGNDIANMGTIAPDGGTLILSGTVTNNAAATISIDAGSKVVVVNGLVPNTGVISLTGGTFDNNGHAMTNTNEISGYGKLSTGGLTNNGSITFTGGLTTVNGDVTNSPGKTIKVAYNPAIFTGNVTNAAGATFTITGTTVTFGGAFSGTTVNNAGAYTASGALQSADPIVNSGSFTQTGALTASADFTNSGTATIGGTQKWSAGTNYNNTAGSTTFASDAGPAGANLKLNVSGGQVTFTATQHLAGLQIGGGKVDLQNNTLMLSYSGTSPAATIRSYLSGGTLLSSAADLKHGLGYADSADGVVSGLAPNTVEVKYAVLGDANLDGKVDFGDLVALARHYGSTNAAWDQGDFNYDGKVNFADLVLLARNYGQVLPASQIAGLAAQLVPEPSVASLLAAAMALQRPRRRTGPGA